MVGGTALEDVDESGSTVRRLGVVAEALRTLFATVDLRTGMVVNLRPISSTVPLFFSIYSPSLTEGAGAPIDEGNCAIEGWIFPLIKDEELSAIASRSRAALYPLSQS